jgi:hypothetical protein
MQLIGCLSSISNYLVAQQQEHYDSAIFPFNLESH